MDLNSNWYYGNLTVLKQDLDQVRKAGCYISNRVGMPFAYAVRPETVGQYTNLKDLNGVEIYEGDLFNLGDVNIPHVVEWIDCGFRGRQLGNRSYVGLEHWIDRIEVVGNRFEHPHLLEKEKE